MLTLSEVLKVTNCSRDDFNNWLRRDCLPVKIESRPGVPTKLTEEAALAVGFMSRLTGVGVRYARASELVRDWLAEHQRGELKYWFAFNPRAALFRNSEHNGFSSNELKNLNPSELRADPATEEIAEWTPDSGYDLAIPATTFVFIERGLIVEIIKSEFSRKRAKDELAAPLEVGPTISLRGRK